MEAVHLRNICKRFGAVQANADVSLALQAGTIHGIVGENGAGKSTLMSILYGFYTADSGIIEVAGVPVTIHNADDAIRHGIGMVHQHFMLVDTLTALDNVMLGAEPSWRLRPSKVLVRTKLEALMASTGLTVQLDTLVSDMSVGDRQRLEILKALYRGARILILDEPTAVLTPQETSQLFEVLRHLSRTGTTIVMITHKLKEVLSVCDFVTVMRSGRVVDQRPIAEASIEGLAQAMVGRKVQLERQSGSLPGGGEVLLHAEGVTVIDARGVTTLANFRLDLKAGEIVGIAGVSGNGQSEVLEVLSGLTQPAHGNLTIGSQKFHAQQWMEPGSARALGVAHVPEDRHARAMVMDFAAWETAVLGYEGLAAYCTGGWMRHARMRSATQQMMAQFDVRPPNPDLAGSKFSGGNQQKLVLAREIGQSPRILLVGQPTRGVDIGAIEFIYQQLRMLRSMGCAILVVSSELDEILALADRVLVMNQGRVTGELPVGECTETRLGLLMTSGVPA